MNKIILPVIIAVVAIVGIAVFLNKKSPEPVVGNPTISPGKSPISPTKSSSVKTTTPSSLSDLLKAYPGPNATDRQKADYNIKISQAAVTSSSFDVTGCNPNPVVLRLKPQNSLTLMNRDSVSHTISHGAVVNLTASANSERTVSVNFLPGPGIYGYQCDGQMKGLFYVVSY